MGRPRQKVEEGPAVVAAEAANPLVAGIDFLPVVAIVARAAAEAVAARTAVPVRAAAVAACLALVLCKADTAARPVLTALQAIERLF